MHQYNIHDAKTHLSKLLERVEAGEEIVISRAGHPVAILSSWHAAAAPRTPGAWRGQVSIATDFDELPQAIRAAFDGDE